MGKAVPCPARFPAFPPPLRTPLGNVFHPALSHTCSRPGTTNVASSCPSSASPPPLRLLLRRIPPAPSPCAPHLTHLCQAQHGAGHNKRRVALLLVHHLEQFADAAGHQAGLRAAAEQRVALAAANLHAARHACTSAWQCRMHAEGRCARTPTHLHMLLTRIGCRRKPVALPALAYICMV